MVSALLRGELRELCAENGEPLAFRIQIHFVPTPGEPPPLPQRLAYMTQKPFTIGHERLVIRLGAVPFQQGELGQVESPALPAPEDGAELEDDS